MKKLDPKAVWLFFASFILRWFFVFLILGVYLSISLEAVGTFIESELSFLAWLWIAIPLLLVFFFIWARLSYHFYRYKLTENGFQKELGVILKKYVTIPYDRIQNVDIYRGIVARLLGLSDVHIQTAGLSAQVSRYGARGMGAEGRLPGLSWKDAEKLRDELIKRARRSKDQGV